MNKCRQARDVMGAYIYGELPPNEMKAIRTHLEACAPCHEEMNSQAAAVGQIPAESPALSDFDKQRIMWSVNGAVRQKPQTSSPLWKAMYGLGATGALASLLLVGIFIGTQRAEQRKPQQPVRPNNAQPSVPSVTATTPGVPDAPVAHVPETPSASPADPGVGQEVASTQPYRQGWHSSRRPVRKPRVRKEKARPLEYNSVEMGQPSLSEPATEPDAGATTAPAPAGQDDVQQTPLPDQGDTP